MSSVIDELERLSTLHEKGALTDEEFAAAKQRVLSDGPEEDSGEERELALVKAERLTELGSIEYAQGNYDKALRCFQGALEIAREIGDKRSQGINLGKLGNVYYSQGQYERAIELYTQALDIAREIGDKLSEGIHLGNLGDALFSLERLDEAESPFRQAILICDETVPGAAGAFRGSLAWLLAQQDQIEEARSMLETGEAQVESMPEEHAKFLAKKGQVQHLLGDADGARASLEQAQALAADLKVGDETQVAQAIRELEAVLGGG